MNPIEISPAQFRRLAERVTKQAAEYLEKLDAQPISPATDAAETLRIFQTPMPEQGMAEESLDLLPEVVRLSRAQNGRFFGYVLGSGEPVAAVADLLASVLNQNVTAWRSGPAAVIIEQTIVGWLAQAMGCPEFRGHLTGGGSSANLMGLAMAREAKAPANERGMNAGAVVYASDEIHMSIPKSVALLGIGRDNLRLIPCDAEFRMITCELERQIVHDKAAGKIPLAVVASAGTVNTGTIDPLREIAEIAHRHNAWFHVDGAYGALAAIAARSKFDGLELADSVSLDPHKWLYQPLDCGCLLYRSAEAAQQAFAHSGDYARVLSADPVEGFAFFEESLELSRRFRALKLWLSLRYHGFAAFRESIAKDLAQARRLADAIGSQPDLELLAPVELSAICFRHRGSAAPSEEKLNEFNAKLLKQVVARGRVYLSNASLRGTFSLRACIVNHRTTDADVDSIIPEVLAAAKEITVR
ncbi:MAG TPA: aminotransferase class V-fold PLP-dependent enzyme [Candidatus Sulfotelmatobacter sp.]|nr:aminotransferase class V-fold PLP-dependent enzyme [Candidatus Sulfotelmatobacter sp.]